MAVMVGGCAPLYLGMAATTVNASEAEASENVSIEAKVTDQGVAVTTAATVHAPFDVIWSTLTDYDHLSRFIPGMDHSRVIDRHGSAAIVEQTGQVGILLFTYPIHVVVESDEHPPSAISIRVLSGNLRRLDGGYHLAAVPGHADKFVLGWQGVIDPDMAIPDFIVVQLLKDNIEQQFLGMVREIERRSTVQMVDLTRH
jgi:ribosome-associated toxin RatA of RatAB toxin-antitoxin module